MKSSHSRARARLKRPPDTMPSLLGPIPVTRVKDLRDRKDTSCFGIFNPTERKVRLDADNGPDTDFLTYWHEWVHVVLFDVGILMDKELEERICNAIALARTRETLDAVSK